jgi:hypothetical protein
MFLSGIATFLRLRLAGDLILKSRTLSEELKPTGIKTA